MSHRRLSGECTYLVLVTLADIISRNGTAPRSERIVGGIEDQAFSRSCDLALRPPPLPRQLARPATHKKTEKERQLAHWIGRGRGWARSRIMGPQESLVLCKSLNTFCPHLRFVSLKKIQKPDYAVLSLILGYLHIHWLNKYM